MTFWDLLENPPEDCVETAALFSWSLNCDFPTPATLFCDLIGLNEDEFGEPLVAGKSVQLGYVELDYLADALKEYTIRPHEVSKYARSLLMAES